MQNERNNSDETIRREFNLKLMELKTDDLR